MTALSGTKSNELFVGVTAWHIYIFDRNFNFRIRTRIKEAIEPSTYEKGYDVDTNEVKIQAKAIDTVKGDIYLLKRKFVESSPSNFWRRATSGFFSRDILQDPVFSKRACATPGNRNNSPARLIWGAFRYVYDWALSRWPLIGGAYRSGMSVPFVTKIGYSLRKETVTTNKYNIFTSRS